MKFQRVFYTLLSTMLLAAPSFAAAAAWGISTNFSNAFKGVFQFLVGLATDIFVVLLLVGGIQYLTAAGNEEASKKAKGLILDAIIGLIIVGIAFAAGNWIITKMQLGRASLINESGGVLQ